MRQRVKFIADINARSLPESTDDDFVFDYVDIGRVSQGFIDPEPQETSFAEAPSRARRLAQPGDSVVSTVRTYLRAVAQVGNSELPQVFSTGFAVLHPNQYKVVPRYLAYYLQSDHFVDRVVAESVGVSYPAINASDLAAFDLDLPDIPEQTMIADFLDRETVQIDALVAEQRELVRLLEERRISAIVLAVTGGERERRDQEASPLGALPADWPFLPVSSRFDVILGKMLDAGRDEHDDDESTPYLRAANVQDFGLALDDVKHMAFRPAELARLDLRAGDLLVVEGGAIGTSHLLLDNMPGWSFQKTLNRVRAKAGGSTRFLRYVIRAYRDLGILDMLGNRSTIAHFTAEKLRALRVPMPDHQTQEGVADHLDHEMAVIDAMIAAANESIALMLERRAALISAAVTGRIDPHTGKEIKEAS